MTLQVKTLEEYEDAYRKSVQEPKVFWEEQAESFHWFKRWDEVLQWDFPTANTKWFIGGELNITVNCLDRHLSAKGNDTALIWEANEPGHENRRFSYLELHAEVCRCANALTSVGVKKGDRVCFYIAMIPEMVIGLLACARIGAVHSVVFAGFSATSLSDRINDAACKWVICCDYNTRGEKTIAVKGVVDEALAMGCPSIENVIVYSNTGEGINWINGRDLWWHEILTNQPDTFEPAVMNSEDPFFILYTSGSTGKPKGVVHTCGGYMVYACFSFKNVFQYQPGEIYWCTADVGWITGHTYIIYGPLLAGATSVLFEGIPHYPDASRFWQVVEKHRVNIFYTAPTAVRALMAAGDSFTEGHDLSSLRVLGTVGEPINEEAWHWYHDKIGKGKAHLVDTWFQTENAGILISSLAGVTDTKPCYAAYPLPGIQPVLLDANGNIIEEHEVEGLLCIRFPWPSILRTTYGDHDRCIKNYFIQFPGYYFTGDGARRDADGRYRIIGRVDDVINVSGHRIGTAEVENAINEHPDIVESAVVGFPHPIKGQAIYAFVIVNHGAGNENKLLPEINSLLTRIIGPFAKAETVLNVPGLPKTRSGKIMRRILRKIAEQDYDNMGDISTLFNPEVVEGIISRVRDSNKAT